MRKYCSAKVDALIDQANQSNDPKKRTVLLNKADVLAMSDHHVLPLFQQRAVRLIKWWVGGYGASPFDTYQGKDLYIIAH